MGDTTGISWADSTWNPWRGCTKVGPGCDHCYAEVLVTGRLRGEWGAGAPRQRASVHLLNEPHKWQRQAEKFMAEHGHPRRVFCSSLADIFDNEVDPAWQAEAFATMEATPDLRWLLCTKRMPNVRSMVPKRWVNYGSPSDIISLTRTWPQNVGLLITTVTADEIRRDVPRLLKLKASTTIPWVGLSIEPMIEDIADVLREVLAGYPIGALDWIILGGESGPQSRPCDLHWIGGAIERVGPRVGAIFVKQMGDNPYFGGLRGSAWTPPMTFTGKGKDLTEWPADLRRQEFPAALA